MAAARRGAASAAPTILTNHAFVPRLGTPGATYAETDATGITVSVTADRNGIVHPGREVEVRVCDLYRLPAAPGTYAWQKRPGAPVEVGTITPPDATTAAEALGLTADTDEATSDTEADGDAGVED